MTVDVLFDSVETTKIIKRVKLTDVQMYDIANVSKISAQLWQRSGVRYEWSTVKQRGYTPSNSRTTRCVLSV
jgi:hypothetical protein